eukprot:352223-Chlamydomonas_euryale.AAC.1
MALVYTAVASPRVVALQRHSSHVEGEGGASRGVVMCRGAGLTLRMLRCEPPHARAEGALPSALPHMHAHACAPVG